MINNRQNGNSRRRSRGGQRPPNSGSSSGRADSGNRIDSRARGNANQLYDKYKALARDAQMQGDRVNTEYYLQFADHYFRVLSETRSRADEAPPRRQSSDGFDDDADDYGEEGEPARADEQMQGREDYRGNGSRDDSRNDQRGNDGRGDSRSDNRGNGDSRNSQGRGNEGNGRSDQYRADQSRNDRARNEQGRNDQGRNEQGRNDQARHDQSRNDQPRHDDGRDARANGNDERYQRPVNGNAAPPPRAADQQRETPVMAREPVAPPVPELRTEEAPAPKRRGRPPKARPVEDADAPAALDADRLPPSLNLSAIPAAEAAEGEPAPKPRARRGRPPANAETTAG